MPCELINFEGASDRNTILLTGITWFTSVSPCSTEKHVKVDSGVDKAPRRRCGAEGPGVQKNGIC